MLPLYDAWSILIQAPTLDSARKLYEKILSREALPLEKYP